jgi:hypothetical protein
MSAHSVNQCNRQQPTEAGDRQIPGASHGGSSGAYAKAEPMAPPSISGMSEGWAGQNSYRRGCRQDQADFVRMRPRSASSVGRYGDCTPNAA